MKSEMVTTDDIKKWMATKFVEYAGQYGAAIHKSLQVNLIGEWIVLDHRKEIFRGDMKKAVEIFNNL